MHTWDVIPWSNGEAGVERMEGRVAKYDGRREQAHETIV